MKILIVMMSAFMFTACATDHCGPTKEIFLENYKHFVEKVESKNLTPDKEEWHNLDEKFDTYISDCYTEFENALTSSERIDVATNTVRYYYSKYGKGISEQLGADPEEFTRRMTQNVEDFLHGNEDEIEALVREFSNRIDRQELDVLIEKGSEIFQSLAEDLEK
jgi:uncharacterized membrane-anchored protein YjiN (DUF445 family)